MYNLGYVRRTLLNKERFHLWDFPADLWGRMNEDQLISIWSDLPLTLMGRIFQQALD